MTAWVRKHPRRGVTCGRRGRLPRPGGVDRDLALPHTGEGARIEHRAHALHQREIFGGEHRRHVLRLVGADAVLAGERAAGIDAVAENLGGGFDRPFRLAGNPLVVADQRVEVAVAGMEDVADAQARSLLEIADAVQHLGQTRPRDDPVLHVVVRRDAPHRRKRRLAAAPDARAMLVARRHLDGRRAAAAADVDDHVEQRRDLGLRPVELDDQDGVGIGEVRVHRGLGRADRQRVHHLDRRRDDAGADDVGHGAAAAFDRVERRE
jgi:hypothetical protein